MTVLFSIARQSALADSICHEGGFTRGTIIEDQFPNGELSVKIAPGTTWKGQDVILIGSTDHRDISETVGLGWKLAKEARSFTLVIPFFRSSTQERWNTDKKGNEEVALAQVHVAMLNTIPRASSQNRVILCDLHADQIADFFDGDRWQVKQVSMLQLLAGAVKSIAGNIDGVMNPDGGREHAVSQAAQLLGVEQSGALKVRLSGEEVHHTSGVHGADVTGRNIIVWDDMIRSGKTANGAAQEAKAAGAAKLWLVATHADFSPGSDNWIKSQGLFEEIIVCDTWPRAREVEGEFVHIVPSAPLFVAALKELDL